MLKTGDIAAIYIDNKPTVYVRVECIEPDMKPRWYQIRLLFLGFPPQEMTWILKDDYINGTPFTMKGISIQIVALPSPDKNKANKHSRPKNKARGIPDMGHVISIDEIRKRKGYQDT
ncbi:MAG: hypothetical protein J7L53_07510 [Deltaproteobacteria bacterium]|nr:hypothetical protein [Deltaproteobacteria bacterium]